MEQKTKSEMIAEILNPIKWCPTTKERNLERANRRNTRENVARIYEQFLKDREHAYYYATLLCI